MAWRRAPDAVALAAVARSALDLAISADRRDWPVPASAALAIATHANGDDDRVDALLADASREARGDPEDRSVQLLPVISAAVQTERLGLASELADLVASGITGVGSGFRSSFAIRAAI